MIGIINYNAGNCGSIFNMIKKIGFESKILNHPDETIHVQLTKLILPGVGAFDYGIQELHQRGWINFLNEKVLLEKIPVLGICLGMQLMTHSSEEGTMKGLSWIDAHVKRFNFHTAEFKVPHIGWNYVQPVQSSVLFNHFHELPRFYFVHSYYVCCNHIQDIAAKTEYGGIIFTSAFQKDNIFGVQFHPEKSHVFGMQVFRNFLEL
ncbi:MAG: imidazole glycerol phosphate synthase subunit HisH [Candidatus Goldbacteria bacterium]|nr:imidazole glycerol phosphate synthase subunit HisH [Candidatus Goldiibacteriota bacterium]